MLKIERQKYILQQLDLHNKILVSSLSQDMEVSDDTIRRDLFELADEGKLVKVHGGALSNSFGRVLSPNHNVYSLQHKRKIALKAIDLIKDGMFVLTTGGTTIVEMARLLPPGLKATFISGSIAAILEYMEHPQIEVILIGDKISKNSKITVGADAIAKVKRIKADICFLGINAIDLQQGITDNDWEVVQLKQAMIETSKLVVCLTIAEKINTCQPLKVCDLDKVDLLITELPPDDPLLEPYAKAGIRIL
ncbi:MAG: DeoR/GlpR transcriptional regulator [Chitinophagaceae bacterium]|nr:MAG: DeoR/GlpR transcriptional regulator [Chitinophagaceae bacterium]